LVTQVQFASNTPVKKMPPLLSMQAVPGRFGPLAMPRQS